MKNLKKFLGIIAILAMIGAVLSCETEAKPDDQIVVVITGLPEGANDRYGFIALGKDTPTQFHANGNAVVRITGSKVRNEMIFSNDVGGAGAKKGDAFGSEGAYYLILSIYTSQSADGAPLYVGYTPSAKSFKKGTNTFDISEITFDKDITDFFSKPGATDFGTYKTTYTNTGGTSITETVVLSATEFKISDTAVSGSNPDQLTFKIEKWESAAVPSGLTGYTGAYKFTGRILSQKNYVPSGKTAPEASGFTNATVAADVKADGTGTECWMYVYFKGETGSITFVRSAFSKTGGTENKAIVTDGSNANRVYTKQSEN